MQSEPIRDKHKLRQLAGYFLNRGQFRNYALVVLGVHTALRISDLLRLSWLDVYDEKNADFRSHISVMEKKTKKRRAIALNRHAVHALRLLLPHRRGDFIFANNRKEPAPISRVQAWRIIHEGVEAVGLDGLSISPHSLRKTFGLLAWQAGVLPVMLMDLFNHSSFEITRRYLGIAQEDRDKVYLNMVVFKP
jgi:integrase